MGAKKKDTGNLGDKANTNGFDKNPQNINRNGPPRKSWNNFREQHPDVEPLTKKAYMDTLEALFNMTEDELKEKMNDKQQPLWLRYMIGDMNSQKIREKMHSDLRDYLLGKASQPVTLESSDGATAEVFIIGGKKIIFGSGKIEGEEEKTE